MRPRVVERVLHEWAEMRTERVGLQQQRAGRHEQAHRVLHGIHVMDQAFVFDEAEHGAIVVERRPRRERYPRRPKRDARGVHGAQRLAHVGARVTLVEMREHGIAERLDRGHDEEAAERRELDEIRTTLQQVLDLGGDVEGHSRKLGVERARDRQRVPRPIQEIGIAEGDVRCARGHELAHVRQHDLRRHDEEAPAVDGRDGAVPALVFAAATRFDIAGELERPISLEMRVPLERRQRRAARHRKLDAREMRCGRGRQGRARLEPAHEVQQRRFDLSAHHGVRTVPQQVLGVQRGVEAVEREVAGRIHGADALGDFDAQTQRGVHRHGDRDETSRPRERRVEAVDRDVQHRRRVAGTLERGGGPRDGERLMPELVTRDEENLAWATHRQEHM